MTMKKQLISALLLMILKASFSQNFEWAKDNIGGSEVIADASGNIYTVGHRNHIRSHGSGFCTTTFIDKRDSAGNLIWTQESAIIGDSVQSYSVTHGIGLDGIGNIYISGSLVDSVAFGNTTLIADSVDYDVFIAKCSPTGQWLWAKSAGGKSSDFSTGICVDATGNSYITGNINSDNAHFDTITVTSKAGAYIAKYNSSGSVQWVKTMDAPNANGYAMVYSIGMNAFDNLYITGKLFDTVNVNSSITIFDGPFFVANSNMAGEWQWAKTAKSDASAVGISLVADDASNVYIGGVFSSSLYFGNDSLALPLDFDSHIFIVKYNDSGDFQWAKKIAPGDRSEGLNEMALDPSGTNIYLAGSFTSSHITIGSTTFTKAESWNADPRDGFIAQMDASGNFQWAKQVKAISCNEGSARVHISAIHTAFNGTKVYATGEIICKGDFGNNMTVDNAWGESAFNFFLAKMNISSLSGLNEKDESGLVNIYPNPANNILNIFLSDAHHDVNITLMDMQGKIVEQRTLENNIETVQFNVNGLSTGMYMVMITDNKTGESKTEKFSKSE